MVKKDNSREPFDRNKLLRGIGPIGKNGMAVQVAPGGEGGSAVFFGLLIYTVEGVAHDGLSTLIVLQAIVAVIVGVIYIRRQLAIEMPILPVDLFRIPIFALSVACSICCFTCSSSSSSYEGIRLLPETRLRRCEYE